MLSTIRHILQSKDQYHLNISFIILKILKASTHSMKLANIYKIKTTFFLLSGVLVLVVRILLESGL